MNQKQVPEQTVPATVARGKVKEKKVDIISQLKYYGVPIASVGVFFGLLLFAVMPTINSINEKRDTIKNKETQISKLDNTLREYYALRDREAQMDEDLALIDKIVPSSISEVANFVGEINDVAEQNSLDPTETQSGETRVGVTGKPVSTTDEEAKEGADIISIPTAFALKGDIDNIRQFLIELYGREEFLIIDSMEIKGQKQREFEERIAEEEGREYRSEFRGLTVFDWTIDVVFGKYQFSENFSDALEEARIPLSQREDELTINLIRDKYGQ